MAETLILIRHGEVEAPYQKKLLGVTDVSLGPEGEAQARALSRFLPTLNPDRVVCSPMKRCLQTASPSIGSLGLALELDEDFREADFGKWECMGFDEIHNQYPEKLSHMAVFDPEFVFPEGERIRDFLIRIQRALDKWMRVPEKAVAVFTHAGVIRFAVCQLMGIDPGHHIAFEINYGSVVILRLFEKKGVLQAVIPVSVMGR